MGWKIYFWIVTVLVFLNEERMVADGLALHELAAIVVEVVAVVGLFSFAYDRRLATPRFWRGLTVLYVAIGLATRAHALEPVLLGILEVLIELVVRIPMYVGLWRYGHPESWR